MRIVKDIRRTGRDTLKIEYPADGLGPVCRSETEFDPVRDYGCKGQAFKGWPCLDGNYQNCDAGQSAEVSSLADIRFGTTA